MCLDKIKQKHISQLLVNKNCYASTVSIYSSKKETKTLYAV